MINITINNTCYKQYNSKRLAIFITSFIDHVFNKEWLENLTEDVVEDSLSKSSNDIELILKEITKAFFWKYFGFEPNEKGNPQLKDHLKCRLCQLDIAAKAKLVGIMTDSGSNVKLCL